MFCRACGNRLDAGSLFCANCGAKTNTSGSGSDFTQEKKDRVFEAHAEKLFESLQTKGFFNSLFDFSFTSLITTKLIRFGYAVSILGLALALFFLIIIGFLASPAVGLLMLVFSPLFLLVGVCYIRLFCEMFIVVFRIAEHTAEIAQRVGTKEAPTGTNSIVGAEPAR